MKISRFSGKNESKNKSKIESKNKSKIEIESKSKTKKSNYLFSNHLTLKSKMILFFRNFKKFILNLEVFNFTGVFIFVILLFYMHWYKALVLGLLGYLIYLRIESTLFRLFRVNNN